MRKRKLTKRSDIILIGILLAAAVSVYLFVSSQPAGGAAAEVIYGGKVVMTVDLTKDRTFSLPEKPNVVFQVKNDSIAFTKSDCPDQICVHTGFISKPGQMAACLPNDLMLKIISKGRPSPGQPDIVN
ncbi:MAG: NusG domain II-containing protein [Clostridiales bacterium]|nr:NusG domain II-containing protein [Clostridiales bacterium]